MKVGRESPALFLLQDVPGEGTSGPRKGAEAGGLGGWLGPGQVSPCMILQWGRCLGLGPNQPGVCARRGEGHGGKSMPSLDPRARLARSPGSEWERTAPGPGRGPGAARWGQRRRPGHAPN